MLGEQSRLVNSEYLEGIERAEFDEEITAKLKSMPSGYPGSEMTLAIENNRGVVYRIITTSGISAFQHVSKILANCGLEDRLANDFSGKYAYNCIFHRSVGR